MGIKRAGALFSEMSYQPVTNTESKPRRPEFEKFLL